MKRIVTLPLLSLIVASIIILQSIIITEAYFGGYPFCRDNCEFWGVNWDKKQCHLWYNQSKPLHEVKTSNHLIITHNETSCDIMPIYMLEESIAMSSAPEKDEENKYYKFIIPHDSGFEENNKAIACWRDETCSSQFGKMTKTNGNGTCSCVTGHIFGESGECISKDLYCKEKYGDNTKYAIENNSCSCLPGYDLVSGTCVSEELSITDIYKSEIKCGVNSYHNGDGLCLCRSGYYWQDLLNNKNLNCVQKEEIKACSSYPNASLGLNGECVCNSGFTASPDRNSCIKVPENAHAEANSSGDVWICDYPYMEEGGSCVEGKNFGEKLCQSSYGDNSTNPNGKKSEEGNYLCGCKEGYKFNDEGTSCDVG